MATKGRPKGSKNKPKIGDKVSFKKLNDMANDAELNRLKNLIGKQDDMIQQLTDEIKRLEKVCQEFENEVDNLEGDLDSFRTILITVLEMSK